MALQAKPNKGHYALAALAKRNTDFMCLTQNVDSPFPPSLPPLSDTQLTYLSPQTPDLHHRASHPSTQLKTLHGSLFTLKCASPTCPFTEPSNFASPLCPALAPAAI